MKLKTVIAAFVIALIAVILPAWAEKASVLDGLFQIYIGQEKINCPLYYSVTVYEKGKSEALTYWFSEMPTCPEIPAGTGANLELESTLFFNGIDKYEEVGMTPDGGLTTFKARRIPNKGWTVKIDLEKMPPGARALQWYVKHRDNKEIIVIFIFRFVSNSTGTESGGIFMGYRSLPPEIASKFALLSARAKRTFFLGMRSSEAYCSEPDLVKAELAMIEQQQQLQNGCGALLIKGKPNAQIEFSYLGEGVPIKIALNNIGQATLNNLAAGKTLKVRYVGGSWQESTVQGGSRQELQLQDSVRSNVKCKVSIYNYLYQDTDVVIEFINPSGQIQQFSRIIGKRQISNWNVNVGCKVRICRDGRWTQPVVIEKNTKISIGG